MGALTSHHKRGNDHHYTLNRKFPFLHFPNYDNQIETHVSKKQKTSSSMDQSTSHSLASRINQYPKPKKKIPREIHAPCRVHKSGFSGNFNISFCDNRNLENEGLFDKLGEELFLKYERTKKCAVESFRYYKDENDDSVTEVIDLGEKAENDEVAFVENGKMGLELEHSSRISETLLLDSDEGNILDSFKYCKEDGEVDSVTEVIDLDKEVDDDRVGFSKNVELVSEMEDAGKILEALLLDSDEDDALVSPVHKKLLESAEKRNDKLSRLSLEIELNEKRLAKFQLETPDEKGVCEDLFIEAFAPLTNEEEEEVSQAFSSYNRRKVLITHENSNIDITGEILQCLRPGGWLNDEVINVYFELLKEREKREPEKFLKCHFFNTFFYKKLIGGKSGYDFKSVRRWTTQKKLGYNLSECDKIFVPIHKQAHWCLAVINKKDHKFQYLDSLGGMDANVLRVLAMYLADELKDKNGVDIDVVSWMQEHVEDIPVQKNGWDCGMFMIKYADFYCRGLGLCFNQENMAYFRRRTAKEILRLEAK